jgi:hypothetical protein
MQLGGLAGMTALTMGLGQENARGLRQGEVKNPRLPDDKPPGVALEPTTPSG